MIYAFDAYEFDTGRRALRRAGSPVRLEPKVYDLLAYLIEHHDHFVSREELYTQLWPEQFVSESALSYCMTEARKAVGDTGRGQRVIKTVYGRGYRFILPVQKRLPDSAPEEEVPLAPPLPEAVQLSPPQPEVLPASRTSQSAAAFPLQPAEATERTWPGLGDCRTRAAAAHGAVVSGGGGACGLQGTRSRRTPCHHSRRATCMRCGHPAF